MNWCLILNDFQTPPKKSVNSISFMHSSPLPWVFLQRHKVFYNHTQTDPATLDHLSTFFSPCPFLKVPCCPPLYLRAQRSFPFVQVPCLWHWYFTLDVCFGGGKQSVGAFFWFHHHLLIGVSAVIMHFYSSDVPRAPVHLYKRHAVVTPWWTALASNLSLSELSFLFSIPPFPLKQWY